MKNSYFSYKAKWHIILVTTLFIITGIILVLVCNERLTKYTLSTEMCYILFGTSPEEYATLSNNEYVTKAVVDQNGNLVISFDDKQKDSAIKFLKQIINENGVTNKSINISNDYTHIFVDTDSTQFEYIFFLHECALIQLLSGVEPDNISIEFSIINHHSGDILYTYFWPQEEIIAPYYSKEVGWRYYYISREGKLIDNLSISGE